MRRSIERAIAANPKLSSRLALWCRRLVGDTMLQALAESLDAAPIQHIGKLLVLWRPRVERPPTPDEGRKPGPRDVKVLKFSRFGGQKPEIKTLRVLGNQRLTPGGQVKRAKSRQISEKKRAQS